MRHFRSILYAIVLAPAVWVLAGIGLSHDRNAGGFEALTGVLLLLSAGAAYAILLLAPISPAGPLLGGLVFFGVAAWAAFSPSTYGGLWPAGVTKQSLDLSLPGYGLAVLLAIPLVCTALSARRWERYVPPKVPVIGTLGQSHGVARPAGIPMTLLETATMRTVPESTGATQVMPRVPDMSDETVAIRGGDRLRSSSPSSSLASSSSPASSLLADETVALARVVEEAATPDVGGPGEEVTATFAVSADGEVTATGAVVSKSEPDTEAVTEAVAESVTEAVSEVAAEPVTQASSEADAEPVTQASSEADADPVTQAVSDPVAQAVSGPAVDPDVEPTGQAAGQEVAEAEAVTEVVEPGGLESDVAESEVAESEVAESEVADSDGATADVAVEGVAAQDVAVEDVAVEAMPVEAWVAPDVPEPDVAAGAEPVASAPAPDQPAVEDEPVTEALAAQADEEPATEMFAVLTEDDLGEAVTARVERAGARRGAGGADDETTRMDAVPVAADENTEAVESVDTADETTDVVPAAARERSSIDEDDIDKTQLIRLPITELTTHELRDRRVRGEGPGERTQIIARDPGEVTQVIKLPAPRNPVPDGEQTQVIRFPSNTVEPPGDRTQVLKLPVVDERPAEPRKAPPPSIVHAERPNPGDDPTTRLVTPEEEPPAGPGEITKRRIMTVMNLERPADEVADDTRRLATPPPPRPRRPEDDDA